MRRKRLAIKILVYLAFAAWLGGIVFLVGYRARHPIDDSYDAQRDQRQAEDYVMGVQEAHAKPYREEAADSQNYAAQWTQPIVILTALLLGVAVWAASVYHGQLKQMRETVAKVGDQGATMKGQLAAMEWQAGIMEIQAGLFDKQVNAMQGQLDAMKDQSQLTAKQIDLMVLTEGAYITIGENWRVDEDSWNGNVLVVHGQIQNGGRTPALNFKRKIAIAIGEGEPPPGWGRFDWDSTTDDSETIVLVSGGKVNCSTPRMKLSDKIQNDLVLGKQMVAIDGQCRYLDILASEQVIYTFGFAIDWMTSRALIRYQDYRREKTNPN